MDLKNLLAKAGVPNEAPKKVKFFPVSVVKMEKEPEKEPEIVHPANEVNGVPAPPTVVEEMCYCGHPHDAHDGEGSCEILECSCTEYGRAPIQPSASFGEVLEAVDKSLAKEPTLVSRSEGQPIPSNPVPETKPEPTAPEAVELEDTLPAPSLDCMPEGFCQHMCDNVECQKWWTHGPLGECKYPDIVKQGLCQACNANGETFQIKPEDDIKDGKLTAAAQIKCRNDERNVCKFMNVEQLTRHIEYHARRIEELRVRSLEARKMRSELEEEELSNIPEHEREAFIQALRRGEAKGEKKPRKARAAKDPAMLTGKQKESALVSKLKAEGKSPEAARVIAAMMVKTGKTQEQVEAWLND